MNTEKSATYPSSQYYSYLKSALLGLLIAICLENIRMPLMNSLTLLEQKILSTKETPFDEKVFLEAYQCNLNHKSVPKIVSHDPLVIVIDDFLADGEADFLIEKGLPNLERSGVTDFDDQGEISDYRTSFTAFYDRSGNSVLHCIEQRVEKLTNFPLVNIEPLQFLRYEEGQQYKVHHDSFGDFEEFFETEDYKMFGDRIATIFVYLNTLEPDQGGETEFPNLEMKVSPVKNRAVFWMDLTPEKRPDVRVEHSGLPIIGNHTKYGLNIWIREGCYEGCPQDSENLLVEQQE